MYTPRSSTSEYGFIIFNSGFIYTFDKTGGFLRNEGNILKLLGIKEHVISGCPVIYMVNILLQKITIRYIINFIINLCIISKTDKVRFGYIFINISNHNQEK